MELQFKILYYSLITTIIAVGIGTIINIIIEFIKTMDYLELLLRLMAISGGVMIIGVSIFTEKPIPELITVLLLNANPLSSSIIIVGYILPIILGVCVGQFLIRGFIKSTSKSFRILCFINTSVIIYSIISITIVSDSLNAIIEHEAKSKNITYMVNDSFSRINNLSKNYDYLKNEFDKILKLFHQWSNECKLEKELITDEVSQNISSICGYRKNKCSVNIDTYDISRLCRDKLIYSCDNCKLCLSSILNLTNSVNIISSNPYKLDLSIKTQLEQYINDLSNQSKNKYKNVIQALTPNLTFLLSVFLYIILMYKKKT